MGKKTIKIGNIFKASIKSEAMFFVKTAPVGIDLLPVMSKAKWDVLVCEGQDKIPALIGPEEILLEYADFAVMLVNMEVNYNRSQNVN